MAVLTKPRSPRMGRLIRQSFAAMTPQERTRVFAMYGVIAGLHVVGFHHYSVSRADPVLDMTGT